MEDTASFSGDDDGPDPEVSGSRLRTSQRDSMFLHATLRRIDSPEAWALRVRNLSAGGLMADCPAPLARDDRVEVDMRGVGVQAGRVAWVRDGRIGIAFDQPIDPLLARKPVTASASKNALSMPTDVRRPGLRSI